MWIKVTQQVSIIYLFHFLKLQSAENVTLLVVHKVLFDELKCELIVYNCLFFFFRFMTNGLAKYLPVVGEDSLWAIFWLKFPQPYKRQMAKIVVQTKDSQEHVSILPSKDSNEFTIVRLQIRTEIFLYRDVELILVSKRIRSSKSIFSKTKPYMKTFFSTFSTCIYIKNHVYFTCTTISDYVLYIVYVYIIFENILNWNIYHILVSHLIFFLFILTHHFIESPFWHLWTRIFCFSFI